MGRRLLAGLASVVMLLVPFRPHWTPPEHTRPTPVAQAAAPALWLGAGAAWDCHGVLWVSYSAQELLGAEWTPRQDDGQVGLEVRDVSGRSQDPRPGGQVGRWGTPESFGYAPAVSGGEGRLRWPELGRAKSLGLHPDKVRVFRTVGARLVSVPVPITEGCPS